MRFAGGGFWVGLVLTAAAAAGGGEDASSDGPTEVDIVRRAEAYRPYDGTGRYTMDTDDGVRGVQGLLELARRRGPKPYDRLALDGGRWRTERVIFRDVGTAATVLRMTNDPWADHLSYFQGNWNANGSTIVWRRRPGMWETSTPTHGPMAMKADGTGMRNVFRDHRMVRGEVCSPVDPDVCYAQADSDKTVLAFDLTTGKTRHVVRKGSRGWHLKVSPDGRYLMNRAVLSTGTKGLWIASVDGKTTHEIPVPEAIHDSYAFHPDGGKIMFWYEGRYRKEGFVQCDLDGRNRTKVGVLFDWNHGDFGLDRGSHCVGYVTRIKGNTWESKEVLYSKPGVEYYDSPHNTNGYTTWWPKDRLWAYHTRICYRPHISEIHAARCEPAPDFRVNRYRICYTGLRRPQALDNPGASPDGTKVLFNSNLFGRVDVFRVVARLPAPPTGLRAVRGPEGVRLTWKPARHHAETAGYRVYRSARSGIDFRPVADAPVAGTELLDKAAPAGACFYAVTAVEHSGLESRLSPEAVAGQPAGKRRIYLEAEDARLTHQMWIAFQGLASDLHYVWMRTKTGRGRADLPLTGGGLSGRWILWARVKGPKGAAFTASAGKSAAEIKAAPSASWTWARAAGRLDLTGAEQLRFASATYGSALDCVVLTDDADFTPAGACRIRRPEMPAPEALKAAAISPQAVRLTWQAKPGETFGHYNVYCSAERGFTPSQAALVGSPDEPMFIDWGLQPGRTLHYRVTCVDRAGREGPAGGPASVALPAVRRVNVERDFADRVEFEVPAKDTYAVWLKVRHGRRRAGYINLTMNGRDRRSWTARMDRLSETAWLSYGRWGRFDLEAGKHALAIENKSRHTIEKVFITNDLWQVPPGRASILSGW